MGTMKKSNLNPRKQPIQQRSSVTVSAIFEATIQVLLRDGYDQFTTTRIAERAGVSVGTLYQYFPNKNTLLCVMLEQHLNHLSGEIQKTCQEQQGQTVRDMMTGLIDCYIDTEIQCVDRIRAFGLLPLAEIGGDKLVLAITIQLQNSLIEMLKTAIDLKFECLETVSFILINMPIGIMQTTIQKDISTKRLDELRYHFIELSVAYLKQIGQSVI